jgi:hypothetical protein
MNSSMIAPGLPPWRRHLCSTSYQQDITPPNDEWAIRDGDLADSQGADASTIYHRSATPSPPRPTTATARRGRFHRMKPVQMQAGVIMSILSRDRWNHIRYAAEKISWLRLSWPSQACIHWSVDAPRETMSNERDRILRILVAKHAYASVAPSDSFFQMQEKTTVNHVLIATHLPKRPRDSVTFEGTSIREKLSSNALEAYPAVHAPIAVQKLYCIMLYIIKLWTYGKIIYKQSQ